MPLQEFNDRAATRTTRTPTYKPNDVASCCCSLLQSLFMTFQSIDFCMLGRGIGTPVPPSFVTSSPLNFIQNIGFFWTSFGCIILQKFIWFYLPPWVQIWDWNCYIFLLQVVQIKMNYIGGYPKCLIPSFRSRLQN